MLVSFECASHKRKARVAPRISFNSSPAGTLNSCWGFLFPAEQQTGRRKKMIKTAIEKIVNKEDLTYEEAYETMNEIMGGMSTSN